MFYLLLLQYLVLLAETGATDSPYEIFRNEVESIVISKNPPHKPQEYWNITCNSSRSNKTWSSCEVLFHNRTYYEFRTYGNMFFCFNIKIIFQQKTLNETKCYKKRNIPIHFQRLNNIEFSSLRTTDSYKTSLKLKIRPSNLMLMNVYRVTYRVKYKSEWQTKSHWNEILSTDKEIVLKDLTPFTNYTFKADVRPSDQKYYMDPLTKYWRTEAAVPHQVETPYFRYYEWSCSHTTNQRCITVYWQSLPMESRNDILTGYCVQYINGSSSTKNSEQCLDSNNLIVDSLYKDFRNLPRNQTLTFSIMAVTKSRRMSQPTFIQVKTTAPKKPTAVYVMRINDKMYNVSWLIEQPQETVNVTVFWCQNKITSSKVECRNEGKWITVVNESYLLVNNSLEHLPVFAAHVNTEEGRSSLTKAECIFTPGKPTKPEKPKINWSEAKISVIWPILYCSDWNGIPVAYVLHYAEGKNCEKDKKKEFPVNGTKTVENIVDINGLESDTEYSVCIQVKTKDGISLMSDTTTGMTKDTDSSMIFLYVFVSLIVGLILISLLITCLRSHFKYVTAIEITTVDLVSSYTDIDCNYEKIQNVENQQMGDNKYKLSNTDESGYHSFNNSSETEQSHFSSQEFFKSDYLQVDELTGKCVDKSENAENIKVKTAFLFNKIEKNENVSNGTDYINISEDYGRICEPPDSVPTCVNGNMKENVSCRTDYVDDPNGSFSELPSGSVPTCVNGNMKENVSCRTDYVGEPNGSFSELPSVSVPTCVNGNMKENVSCRTDYVDDPNGSFSEFPSVSVPTCVNGNMKEHVSCRTDYVDDPNGSFSELPSMSVPTSMNDNFMENVSSRTDYVDEPSGLTKLVSNSIPSEESTNSYKSKPLKGQILQTENKENNQIETSKINGRTDEENVKVNFNDGYVPHEHIVEVTESSLDEVKDKNIQKDRQRISQNPVSSCDLVNVNVHKASDSLQRQNQKMDKLKQKYIEQETGTFGYVKTENFLGYVPNDEISYLE